MPDVHIFRHGDRWAVADAPGETPYFESYTREEAESEARQRAAGGRVTVEGEAEGESAVGQVGADAPPEDLRGPGAPERPGETFRETQAGL